ncbi:Tryptophan--tRNA ligase, mitochondrial [Elasticomyces elasticus]|nr:Tryptophan--tRNA ligase, mitochondrial [Elasticomyces elasticus]KAK4976051.1 Tryptophan--tRNA ligase, mitochondrial [Elasticomyces elasticus]
MSLRLCAVGRVTTKQLQLQKLPAFQCRVGAAWMTRSRSQSTTATSPETIFSGIQPTGVPHLGNYLGALREWVNLQDNAATDTTLIYSLVDLHAITVRQDPAQLRQWKKESLAMLLAIGLDPNRSIIFHQSDVPAHAELMWILSCQASTGYLARMTQWKDKTANEKGNSEKLKLGLFSYPVLQAADVLVHRTTHVPVGHDQAQHLEFAREVANGFNHTFDTDVLVAPETIISPAKRVMSLTDPLAKMSKSHPNSKSRILLTDSEEAIRNKLKAAVTDSIDGITYDPERRPGVSNLIDILYHADPRSNHHDQAELVKDLQGLSMRYLKDRVADAVNAAINDIRARYEDLVHDESYLQDVAEQGARKANESAAATLRDVKGAVGLA